MVLIVKFHLLDREMPTGERRSVCGKTYTTMVRRISNTTCVNCLTITIDQAALQLTKVEEAQNV